MVREQKATWIIVISLIGLFGICIGLRFHALGRSRLRYGDNLWRLTYDIELLGPLSGKVNIALPDNTPNARLFRESFSHPGLWMDIHRQKTSLGREAVLTRAPGFTLSRFSADFSIQYYKEGQPRADAAKTPASAESLKQWLRAETHIQVDSPVIAEHLESITSQVTTKQEVLDAIFDFCTNSLVFDRRSQIKDAETTLRQGRGTSLGRTRAMVALCRAAQIPARLVTGVQLKTQTRVDFIYWVEAYLKKRWHALDPAFGFSDSLPSDYLPLVRGISNPVRPLNPQEIRAIYTLRRIFPAPRLLPMAGQPRWINVFDLTRMGPGMQAVLIGLLLLPLGALITAIFRNVVGIQTYGTFAPSLIALSLIETDAITAGALIGIMLSVGLGCRVLLNRLKLLMVARLGVVLAIVVLTMMTAISILDYWGVIPSASATLMPMIILTMMIERFHVTAEEDGVVSALRRFVGTLLVAAACWIVLGQRLISQLVISFPEYLFMVAAALLLIGRYAGYRLNELWRFRDLASLHPRE